MEQCRTVWRILELYEPVQCIVGVMWSCGEQCGQHGGAVWSIVRQCWSNAEQCGAV